MTIGEWVDGSGRTVPAVLRRSLDARGPVSAETLLRAAEREASIAGAGSARSRAAAFSLLGADAYITYACLWTVRNAGRSHDLKGMTARIAGAPWQE